MKEIVRIYRYPNGKETCIQEPAAMVELLSNPPEDLDLDYHDARGHAKIATSRDLIGQTVKVRDIEIEIPEH